jgi:acyl carrier protein
MNQSRSVENLVALVIDAVTSVSPDHDQLGPGTPLIGESAELDSVGFVSLLVSIEERLHGGVDLASSFMAHDNPDAPDHPFRTISSLAEHLHGQLSAS